MFKCYINIKKRIKKIMKNYRYWYFAYILIAIILYFCLNEKLLIIDTDISGKISLIASIS